MSDQQYDDIDDDDYAYERDDDDEFEDYCSKCGHKCGRGAIMNRLCPMCYECTGGIG